MVRQTYEKKSISLEMATKMTETAMDKAKEIGVPMVIAIVDESGNIKSLCRMDGAALLSLQVAQDKAYTAIGFGMATDEWYPSNISRLVVFGGGYPIKVDGVIVGGIGVSGGHYKQDMECAKAALEVIR